MLVPPVDATNCRQQQSATAAVDDVILRPLVDHINPYMPDLDSTNYEYLSKVWSGEREPIWRDGEPAAVMSAAWRENIKVCDSDRVYRW